MREMGKVLDIPEDILGRFSDLYARGDYTHTLELQQHIENPACSTVIRACQR